MVNMKFVSIISLLFFLNTAFGQYGSIQVVVTSSDSNFAKYPALVELTLDSQKIKSGNIQLNQPFRFEKLVPGMYKLSVTQIGRRTDIYDSLFILDGQTNQLNATYPRPCQFIYPDGFKPRCPYGHTDNIIPIVYGMPGKNLMEKAKKGKIHLGGCIITDCDPRFYCSLHKIEI
jgi:hypothetical protein